MRLIVTGGRNYPDMEHVFNVLDALKPSVVIHGGAPGAEAFSAGWAAARKIPVEVYEADWTRWGRSAGPRRNLEMVQKSRADLVCAFEGNTGTHDCARPAPAPGTPTVRVALRRVSGE